MPQEDVTYACWEDVRQTTVDFQDVWAAWFQISATGAYGFHGSLFDLKNASYWVEHNSIREKNFKSTLQAVQLGRMVLSYKSEFVLEDSNGV